MGERIDLDRAHAKTPQGEEKIGEIIKNAERKKLAQVAEELKEEGITPERLQEEIDQAHPILNGAADRAEKIAGGKTWIEGDPDKPDFHGG